MNETGMAAAPAEAAWRIWQAPRQQTAFRQLMTAFSYPRRVVPLADGAESAATAQMTAAVTGMTTEPITRVAPALVALPEITLSWGFPRHAAMPLQTISASSSSAAMAAISSSIIGYLSSGL